MSCGRLTNKPGRNNRLSRSRSEVGLRGHFAAVGGHESCAVLNVLEGKAFHRACACTEARRLAAPVAMPSREICIALASVPVPARPAAMRLVGDLFFFGGFEG